MGNENQRGGSGNPPNDRNKASETGKKGAEHPQRESQKDSAGSDRPGNFANDPGKAKEAGKKGGEQSRGGR